jgi:glutamine synthetase
MIETNNNIHICEYIWLDGKGQIRSKTRCIINKEPSELLNEEWNYDASSTYQANSDGDTEGILKPRKICKNPLIKTKYNSYIILCDTYDKHGNPLEGNYRPEALKIFDQKKEERPWFGLEQEYFILHKNGMGMNDHYCRGNDVKERLIVEQHLEACLDAGLQISGLNAEVVQSQWEFQIGPSEGIDAADQLIIARYLLEQISFGFMTTISYYPKPFPYKNGSGCHTNFSTQKMREPDGITEIYSAINRLKEAHEMHMESYGEDNKLRLTGTHETANYDVFSYGIGTRNTSIRIPNIVNKNGYGYFEDRRPASNIDPYKVTSLIFKTCCL